jgi:hypothetical protein
MNNKIFILKYTLLNKDNDIVNININNKKYLIQKPSYSAHTLLHVK